MCVNVFSKHKKKIEETPASLTPDRGQLDIFNIGMVLAISGRPWGVLLSSAYTTKEDINISLIFLH